MVAMRADSGGRTRESTHLRVVKHHAHLSVLRDPHLLPLAIRVTRDGPRVHHQRKITHQVGAQPRLQSLLLGSTLAVLARVATRNRSIRGGVVLQLAREPHAAHAGEQWRAAHGAARLPQAAFEDTQPAEDVAALREPGGTAHNAVADCARVFLLLRRGRRQR